MKKLSLFVAMAFAVLLLVSCPDSMAPKAGDPVLKNIDFKSYDSFAVMKESSSGAKSLSDGISSDLNRLFGLADSTLEKISIVDEKGLEWACNAVKNVGGKYLLISLSYANQAKNYCIDRISNAILDLSFLLDEYSTDFSGANIQTTTEGLFAKKGGNAVKMDIDAKTLIPLTNPETDGAQGFYRFDNGIMLVRTNNAACKFFPPNGAPIDYTENSDIRRVIDASIELDSMQFLSSPDLNFIVDVGAHVICRVSESGLAIEPLPVEKGGELAFWGLSGKKIYPLDKGSDNTRLVFYHKYDALVTIHDVSTGELEYTEYTAPAGITGAMGYHDGSFIYSINAGIFSLDLESQVATPIFEGDVSSWKMAPGGLIYTEYINGSATDVQTCFYNFATKETEVLSSSGVEVVSIASFVD